LFVNVEPAAVSGIEPPTALLAALRERGIGLVIDLTERALTDDPARLLALADWARAAGWGVALDDVGADPDSLDGAATPASSAVCSARAWHSRSSSWTRPALRAAANNSRASAVGCRPDRGRAPRTRPLTSAQVDDRLKDRTHVPRCQQRVQFTGRVRGTCLAH